MRTCTKVYTNFPAAHRVHTHDGHCRKVHGHNWSFAITFVAATADINGFAQDFGKLDSVRNFLKVNFDHTLLIQQDDPELQTFLALNSKGLADVVVLSSVCSEGLAAFVYAKVNDIIRKESNERVRVAGVVCREDDSNSADYGRLA